MVSRYYPQTIPLLGLLAAAALLVVGGSWAWQVLDAAAGEGGATSLSIALRVGAFLLRAGGVLAFIFFLLPLVQRYLRRRPTLEIHPEGLVLTMGLGRVHELSWDGIAEVRAHKLRGLLRWGWVSLALKERHRFLGREAFVPQLYLDQGVDEVAAALEPHVGGGGRRR